MEWIDAENGEVVRKSAIVGIGKVKPVKVSSGKGESLVEKTVFNFAIRLGNGGTIIKSPDYDSEDFAKTMRLTALA